MCSCHNTAVFIVVARAACGVQVPTSRRPQDGRKWSAGKFKDMSAHQCEEAQNGGCSPQSVLNYLEIWLRRPATGISGRSACIWRSSRAFGFI